MTNLWTLSYLIVTLSGGHISYTPATVTDLDITVCHQTMWQLDEVYAPLDKGEYKKFVEIHCRLQTDAS